MYTGGVEKREVLLTIGRWRVLLGNGSWGVLGCGTWRVLGCGRWKDLGWDVEGGGFLDVEDGGLLLDLEGRELFLMWN